MFDLNSYSSLLGAPGWAIMIILVWSFVWKGLALWKSARKNSPIWFLVILLINTFGILEILYLFLFSRIKLEEVNKIKDIPSSAISKKSVKKKVVNKKKK